MSSRFALATKSTIDSLAAQFASLNGLPLIDLDADLQDQSALESDQTALVLEYNTIIPDPVDPLYSLSFDVGIMTGSDPAQYESLGLLSDLMEEVFAIGKFYDVRDSSGPTASSPIGSLFITQSAPTPRTSDKVQGVRYLNVRAVANRHV